MVRLIYVLFYACCVSMILFFAAMMNYLHKHWNAQVVTAGDVGDFVGGLAGVIGLIAGLAAFFLTIARLSEAYDLQRAADRRADDAERRQQASEQRQQAAEVRQQEEHQRAARREELMRTIAASSDRMATIAEQNAAMAEEIAKRDNALARIERQPLVVWEYSIGDGGSASIHKMGYHAGIIRFVNKGKLATFHVAESRTAGFHAELIRTPIYCGENERFEVRVQFTGDMLKAGRFRLILSYTDALGEAGWTEATFPNFEATPVVRNHETEPE